MTQEWNKIDLHLHTVVGYTGDCHHDVITDFSYLNFINVIIDNDISLAAITNHNFVDIVNFVICKFLCEKANKHLLFGVELDSIKENGDDYHMVMLFNEDLLKCIDISKYVSTKVEEKLPTKKIRFDADEIIYFFKSFECLMIPHGAKNKGLLNRPTENEIINCMKKVEEGFLHIFDSHSDWKLELIKDILKEKKLVDILDDFGGVLFSDTRKWLNYDSVNYPFCMHAEPTFSGLIHAITNPTKRFCPKTMVPIKSKTISRINITKKMSDSRIDNSDIKLSQGYNCIIGKSGSGKSLLLDLIRSSLSGSQTKYPFSSTVAVTIYDENNAEIHPKEINFGEGKPLFDRIWKAADSKTGESMYGVISLINKDFIPKVKFNEFVINYKTKLKEYSLNKNLYKQNSDDLVSRLNTFSNNVSTLQSLKDIKIFEVELPEKTNLIYTDEELEKIKTYKDSLNNIDEIINILKIDDKTELIKSFSNFKIRLLNELKKVSDDIQIARYKNKKLSIIKASIIEINKNVSENSAKKSRIIQQIDTDISDLASDICSNFIKKNLIQNVDFSISIDDINSTTVFDNLNGVKIEEFINVADISNVSEKDNNIFYTYGIKQQLSSKQYDLTKKDDAMNLINTYYNLNKLSDDFINRVFCDISLNVNVYFDGQNVKELNPGSIAKKSIELYFTNELAKSENSIVLYDQIENDVDKEFIKTTILDLINKIEKNVQLIIVTHDPIVAVNADPISYVEAIKDENNHIKYRDFKPESEEKDELNTIASIVDGSKNVIKKRYEIYKKEKDE